MKIRVYGFKFDKTKFPPAMPAAEVFSFMQAKAGSKLGKLYRYGTHRIPAAENGTECDWWAGMILKVRDSIAFTKLTEKDGKTFLTAEELSDNEKLVELTYFVANPQTGSGLLAHHYHGTSLLAFASVCKRTFRLALKHARSVAAEGRTTKEKKAIAKSLKGELKLDQLCNDTDLKGLVKQLKRISSVELRIATLETKETFLQGIIEKASNEVIKLTFPPDVDMDELADEAIELADRSEVAEIKVTGYDDKKNRRELFKDRNPLVFYEFDYDDMMKGLVLDLDDWAKSIESSGMIKKLIGVAAGKSTLALLKST